MELIVALLMIVNGEIKEHRIQIDPESNKPSMSMCLKGKRVAMRSNKNNNVIYQSRWPNLSRTSMVQSQLKNLY